MGVDDLVEHPKKKLKQAQLIFPVSLEKCGSKRKLTIDVSPEVGSALKVSRKDPPEAVRPLNFDKENGTRDEDVVRVEDRRRPSGGILMELDDGSARRRVQDDCNVEIDMDSDVNDDVVVDGSDRSGEQKLNQSVELEGDADLSIILSSEDDQNVSTASPSPGNAPPSTATKQVKSISRLKRQEEKQRLKRERDDFRRQKKEDKEKKRLDELRAKEEEKKKKEDEKKRREETKEEEKKRREDEKRRKEEVKEEERRKKDEERKKKEELKEEDRKKKEEAKLAEERKENLAKLAFTKFFVQNKAKTGGPGKAGDEGEKAAEVEAVTFMPFRVKNDMRLAAQTRNTISEEQKAVLSRSLTIDGNVAVGVNRLYLSELSSGLREPCRARATWPASEEQHDLIIVESTSDTVVEEGRSLASKGARAKLLQFHDNRRPPYWGTWRRVSGRVKPRRPLELDGSLDYEVDSDSEWEDEGEGEDLDKEGESDKEQSDDDNVGENGYLLDNTFVPHGYLSDEEAPESEETDEKQILLEDQKMKLKVLKQEFEQELGRKAVRLKPRLLGCVWISNETEVSHGSLYETLMSFRCRWDEEKGPVEQAGIAADVLTTPPTAKFPSALLRQLANTVHGSRLSHVNLVAEFFGSLEKGESGALSSISKRAVSLKIREIAQKSSAGRVWEVRPSLMAEFGLTSLAASVASSEQLPEPHPAAPKAKESPLANFLGMAVSVPAATPKRRVVPTLISPLVSSPKSTTAAPRRIVPTALPPDPSSSPRRKINTVLNKSDKLPTAVTVIDLIDESN